MTINHKGTGTLNSGGNPIVPKFCNKALGLICNEIKYKNKTGVVFIIW